MTQWYGPQGDFYHANGQGGSWVARGDGSMYWQPYAGSSLDQHTIWYGPNANFPGAPTATPTATPPSDQDLWNAADPNKRSYRYFSPDLKQYYESNPTQAYSQWSGDEFGTRQTPLLSYANDRYSKYYSDYIRASESDPTGGMHWTDYLSNDVAGQLRNSFNLESPSTKGYTLYAQPAGRITW